MNVSIYISEFFSCLICLCECTKHKWSMNNMWLFFLFSLYCLALYFSNSSQEQEGNHFPAPFLFVSFFFRYSEQGL